MRTGIKIPILPKVPESILIYQLRSSLEVYGTFTLKARRGKEPWVTRVVFSLDSAFFDFDGMIHDGWDQIDLVEDKRGWLIARYPLVK